MEQAPLGVEQRHECAVTSKAVVVALALTAPFTLLILQYSLMQGLLLFDPTYDDVVYLYDGLQRLPQLHRGGTGPIKKVVKGYIESPPHAPGSTYLAMLGFALFGPHDYGPYVCQAIWVFAALLFVHVLLRRHGTAVQVLACAYVLTMPLLGHTIHEFRPDLAWGLLCSIGVILLLRHDLAESSLGFRLVLGLAWGLAFWVKPSAFPLTMIHGTAAFCASYWLARAQTEDRPSVKHFLRRASPSAIACFMVAAPHFVLTGTHYAQYLWVNLFGSNKQLFRAKGGWLEHVEYYLNGEGGARMLGSHGWVLAGLLLLTCLLCRKRMEPVERRRLGALVLMLLVSYVSITASPTKTWFIGSAFFWLVLFGALMALDLLLRLPAMRTPFRRIACLVLLLLLGIGLFKWPRHWGEWNRPATSIRRETIRTLGKLVSDASHGESAKVFFGVFGNQCNGDTLNYVLLRDFPGSRPIQMRTVMLSDPQDDSLTEHQKLLAECDLAITGDKDSGEEAFHLPNVTLQERIAAMLSSHPDFERIGSVPTFKGKHLYVYRRKDVSSQ